MITARAIMTEKLVTIQPESSIESAIEILVREQISGLPVTDKQGQLVGLITEFALLAIAYDLSVRNDTVAQYMTTELYTVEADAPINKVVDLCITHRVRRVPVLENGQLIGLIARRDVLQAMHEAKAPVCTS